MWRFSPASTHYICCRYESVLELSKPPTLWCLCIHAVANSRSHCVVVILQSVSISYRVASKSVALLKLHITSITVYRKNVWKIHYQSTRECLMLLNFVLRLSVYQNGEVNPGAMVISLTQGWGAANRITYLVIVALCQLPGCESAPCRKGPVYRRLHGVGVCFKYPTYKYNCVLPTAGSLCTPFFITAHGNVHLDLQSVVHVCT